MSLARRHTHNQGLGKAAKASFRQWIQKRRPLRTSEVDHLRRLNWRFSEIEALCLNEARRIKRQLKARADKPSDALWDFEIEATVALTLREEDPAWDEDDDNTVAAQEFSLRYGESRFCDGIDRGFDCDPRMRGPQGISAIGWMFHHFHNHCQRSSRNPFEEGRNLPLGNFSEWARYGWISEPSTNGSSA